jgi:hypothetical protein
MPTSQELNTVLLRPLLERRPDLRFARRVLFFSPLRHYLRGVVFVSNRSGAADVVAFACPLYTGCIHVEFDATAKQYEFRLEPEWKDDPVNASRELCEVLEQRFLPPVEPIVDFEKHVQAPAYIPVKEPDRWQSPGMLFWRALAACTLGDADTAEEILERAEAIALHYSRGPLTEEFRFGDFFQRVLYLLHILRTDRSRILPLLHDWEAFMVKSCRMAKYWKPSPFPCEL